MWSCLMWGLLDYWLSSLDVNHLYSGGLSNIWAGFGKLLKIRLASFWGQSCIVCGGLFKRIAFPRVLLVGLFRMKELLLYWSTGYWSGWRLYRSEVKNCPRQQVTMGLWAYFGTLATLLKVMAHPDTKDRFIVFVNLLSGFRLWIGGECMRLEHGISLWTRL